MIDPCRHGGPSENPGNCLECLRTEVKRLEQENRELREERDNLAAWQKEALPKFTEYSARAQAAEDRLAQVSEEALGLREALEKIMQIAGLRSATTHSHGQIFDTASQALATPPTRQESAREEEIAEQEARHKRDGAKLREESWADYWLGCDEPEAAASRPATAQAGRCEPECDDPICARIGHFGLPVDLCRNDACHLVGEHERDDYCPPEPPAGEEMP